MIYALIPSPDDTTIEQGYYDTEIEYSDVVIFKSDMDYDDLSNQLSHLCKQGKIHDYVLIDDEALKEAIDIKELFIASLKEDLDATIS